MPLPLFGAALRVASLASRAAITKGARSARRRGSQGNRSGVPASFSLQASKNNAFDVLQKELERNNAQLFDQIGRLLVKSYQKNFRRQGNGEVEWKARSVPNLAGVIADLKKGTTIAARRFKPRPALVDTGKLRRSIKYIKQKSSVKITTDLSYGALQQTGGQKTIKITKAVKKNLQRKRGKQKAQLKWLLNKDKLDFNIPARPFIGPVSAEDERKIDRKVIAFINKKLN